MPKMSLLQGFVPSSFSHPCARCWSFRRVNTMPVWRTACAPHHRDLCKPLPPPSYPESIRVRGRPPSHHFYRTLERPTFTSVPPFTSSTDRAERTDFAAMPSLPHFSVDCDEPDRTRAQPSSSPRSSASTMVSSKPESTCCRCLDSWLGPSCSSWWCWRCCMRCWLSWCFCHSHAS
ncbi:uncharacterized protein K489DRAFT_65877 [Dissoconium aciculare CBS 342.82]|uniref:Uncharacterized protein n=1 Tax=Dissoconium aciculare CBS 342.82 TaxID=1314786 RepID=A0A6J3LUF2_9PEZI|nr:uncharacterized protein K489DRAFT_65877 [Dissoconium aciculare CBS 342.82]KAF1819411.1 hypothetical protein K489DRAFT_65877 [Dissoconium aciculare CBS 342.82]